MSAAPPSNSSPDVLRTAVNILTNWAFFFFATAITFVLSPIVVHALGDVRYGVWGIVGSVVGYLGLLDLGIRVGVTRFVARHHAIGDEAALNRVITTTFGMFGAAGAAAMGLGVLLSVVLPRITQIPPELARETSLALIISSVTVAAGLLGGVFGGNLAGRQKFALANMIDFVTEVGRAIGIVLALRAGGGLIGISLIQLVAVGSRGILYYAASRHLQPGLQISRANWDLTTLREIFRFSSLTMILHMSAMVIYSSDAMVIAAIMPVTQVTIFVIAANLGQAALQVLGGVSRVAYPLISARQAIGGTSGTTKLVRDSIRLSTVMVLPIVVSFLVRGSTFIKLWMGPQYGGPAGEVLRILAIGLCVFTGYHVLVSNIIALNLHRGLVAPFVLEAIANLSLSFVLGSYMGVDGVAWGTTLPRVALAVGFAPWFMRRKLGLGVREYAMHAWGRPLASMIPFAVASALIERWWPASSLVVFFTQVGVALPLAVLGAWVVGLESGERERIMASLRSYWAGPKLVPGKGVGPV